MTPRRASLLAAVVLLASLPLLATIAITVLVDGDEVVAWLEPRLSGALNREVTVGDAGVAMLPRPGLRLADVRVGGADGSDLPSVVTVRDVHLEAAFLPLLRGRVRADRLRLKGLDVHLVVTDSGVSNFGDLVPESSVGDASLEGPVGFAIEEVDVDDASLTFFDGVRDRSFAVVGGSGSLGLGVEPDGTWIASWSGRADSLLVRLPGLSDEIVRTDAPSLAMSLRGDRSLDGVEIEEGTLTHWGEAVSVRGRIAGIAASDPVLDLRIEHPALDLTPFTRLLPASVRARRVPAFEGVVDLALSLSGSLRGDDEPALRGSLELSGVGLRLGGEPLVTDLNGRLGLRSRTLVFDSVVGTFANGPFLLSGALDRETKALEASVVASPDLGALDRLGLAPFGATLAGEAELVMDVAGRLGTSDSLRLNGSVRTTGVRAEHEGMGVPLYGSTVALEVVDSELFWEDVELLVGDDPLTTSGRLSGALAAASADRPAPVLEASVRAARLDLRAVRPPPESRPEVPYARIAFAHLGGREIEGRSVRDIVRLAELERPEALPVHGSVRLQLGRLEYGVHELADVGATLVLSDSAVGVEGARFGAWGGGVEAEAHVGVGRRIDEPFSLTLRVDRADAPAVLGVLTPVGDAVSGRLALEVSVEGSTDRDLMPVLESLHGGGTVTVTEGAVAGTGVNLALADFLGEERWRRVPFTEWRTDFELREGMIDVRVSELTGERVSATLSGAVGLGGAVDLAMALSIPADQLEAVSLRRTGVAQTVLDRLEETHSALDLGIRVSGTLEGPTLEPDALAASERLAARR